MILTTPYEKLALIYDRLMSHVNYKQWAEYVRNLFQYADRDIKQIVDISVGTGSLIQYLNKSGYNCYGSDLSFLMILQAKAKLQISGNIFIVSDATQLAFASSKFDAVLFLYDSLNYLTTPELIESFLAEVKRILKEGGVFIFDIITDILCKTFYDNFEEQENWGDSGYVRHSYYNQEENIQYNDFKITIGGKKYFERHCQRIYSDIEIKKYLQKYSFEALAQLDDFTYLTANANSERIHYVCIKRT